MKMYLKVTEISADTLIYSYWSIKHIYLCFIVALCEAAESLLEDCRTIYATPMIGFRNGFCGKYRYLYLHTYKKYPIHTLMHYQYVMATKYIHMHVGHVYFLELCILCQKECVEINLNGQTDSHSNYSVHLCDVRKVDT